MGDNIITLDREGKIISSDLSGFRVGNTVWDYIAPKYHHQLYIIITEIDNIRRQPVLTRFEVLHNARFYHRSARVFNTFDGYILAEVEDVVASTNLIDYTTKKPVSYNEFLVAPNGLILHCLYPDRAIDDPVGINIFDVILPQYRSRIRSAIKMVLKTHIPLPTEYGFIFNGVFRCKKGVIKYCRGNVIFAVQRIAPLT